MSPVDLVMLRRASSRRRLVRLRVAGGVVDGRVCFVGPKVIYLAVGVSALPNRKILAAAVEEAEVLPDDRGRS